MTELLTISYRSSARLRDQQTALQEILGESRDRNARLGITGILLFDGTYFMQTIEGPTDDTSLLFTRIVNDGRHHDVVPFGISKIETRTFPDWTMHLIGPETASRIVPDMIDFDFTERRLSQVHQTVKDMAA